MARERIYIYDTTLRDGQQTPGVDFSVEDKKSIVVLLEELGVDYVEGGYPGANPTDTAFFQAPPDCSRQIRRFWHDEACRRFGVQRSRPVQPATGFRRCRLLCCQELGLSCPARAWLHQ